MSLVALVKVALDLIVVIMATWSASPVAKILTAKVAVAAVAPMTHRSRAASPQGRRRSCLVLARRRVRVGDVRRERI